MVWCGSKNGDQNNMWRFENYMDSSYGVDLDLLTISYLSCVSYSGKSWVVKTKHLRHTYSKLDHEDTNDTPRADLMRQVGMTTQLARYFFIVHFVVIVVILYSKGGEGLNWWFALVKWIILLLNTIHFAKMPNIREVYSSWNSQDSWH